jgi:hypothetical protein
MLLSDSGKRCRGREDNGMSKIASWLMLVRLPAPTIPRESGGAGYREANQNSVGIHSIGLIWRVIFSLLIKFKQRRTTLICMRKKLRELLSKESKDKHEAEDRIEQHLILRRMSEGLRLHVQDQPGGPRFRPICMDSQTRAEQG